MRSSSNSHRGRGGYRGRGRGGRNNNPPGGSDVAHAAIAAGEQGERSEHGSMTGSIDRGAYGLRMFATMETLMATMDDDESDRQVAMAMHQLKRLRPMSAAKKSTVSEGERSVKTAPSPAAQVKTTGGASSSSSSDTASVASEEKSSTTTATASSSERRVRRVASRHYVMLRRPS